MSYDEKQTNQTSHVQSCETKLSIPKSLSLLTRHANNVKHLHLCWSTLHDYIAFNQNTVGPHHLIRPVFPRYNYLPQQSVEHKCHMLMLKSWRYKIAACWSDAETWYFWRRRKQIYESSLSIQNERLHFAEVAACNSIIPVSIQSYSDSNIRGRSLHLYTPQAPPDTSDSHASV